MSLEEANHYVISLIHKYLEEKQKKNSRYSLRKLAKTVNVSAATLSQALRSKRNITKSTAKKIIAVVAPDDQIALGYVEAFREYYPAIHKEEDQIVQQRIPKDELLFFQKWYHLAMITFFDSCHYDGTPDSAESTLGFPRRTRTMRFSVWFVWGLLKKRMENYKTPQLFILLIAQS